MPLSITLARFNRRVTNPVARVVAGRVPLLAIVEHRGRRSGTMYRTPVMAFRDGDGWVIALTYGPGTEWVRNVLAADGCDLVRGGRRIALTDPRVSHEAAPPVVLPVPVRLALRLFRVPDYLRLRRVG